MSATASITFPMPPVFPSASTTPRAIRSQAPGYIAARSVTWLPVPTPCIRPSSILRESPYFFYHTGALPTGGSYRRSVCVEELHYNPDGSIQPIVMTGRLGIPVRLRCAPSTSATASSATAFLPDAWRTSIIYPSAHWHLVPGLADPTADSLESVSHPGYFLRQTDYGMLWTRTMAPTPSRPPPPSVVFLDYPSQGSVLRIPRASRLLYPPQAESPLGGARHHARRKSLRDLRVLSLKRVHQIPPPVIGRYEMY